MRHAAVWTCYARIPLLYMRTRYITFYTHYGPVHHVAVNFITNLSYSEIQVKFSSTFPQSTVTGRRRRRATWQPLSDKHQLAAQQMQRNLWLGRCVK